MILIGKHSLQVLLGSLCCDSYWGAYVKPKWLSIIGPCISIYNRLVIAQNLTEGLRTF